MVLQMADYHILHARWFGSNMWNSLLVVITICIFAAYSDIFRKRNIKILLSVYVINIIIIFSLIYMWNNRFHSSINIFFVLLGLIVSIVYGIKDTNGRQDNNEDSMLIKGSMVYSIFYIIIAIISATYDYAKSDIYIFFGLLGIILSIVYGIKYINGREDNNEDIMPIKEGMLYSILYIIIAIILATYAYIKSDVYGYDWILILILFGIGIINYLIRAIAIK